VINDPAARPEDVREPHRPPPTEVPATGGLAWRRASIATWAGLIALAFGLGAVLRRAGALPVDGLPPLHASPRLVVGPLLPAAAVALIGVAVLPVAARRLPWRPLLAVAWLGSAGWAMVLALPDGLARPLTTPTEYLAGLPAMGDDPLGWLRGFTRHMQLYPTHVKGHPPLPMLILWTIDRAGLTGAGWAAALVIGAGSSATAAIAVTVRVLAGADVARRAVPFLVLAPTALWVATSVDALFLGVAAWGVALVAIGAAGTRSSPGSPPRPSPGSPSRSPSRPSPGSPSRSSSHPPSRPSSRSSWGLFTGSLASSFAGGLLLGSLPYLSYGLLPIFALPLAVLVLTRPARPVLIALAAGLLIVPVAFTIAGFSWWEGVVGTHAAWAANPGSRLRPYAYFLLGDLAVLALLIGPATAQALPSAVGRAAAVLRRGRGRWFAHGADRHAPAGDPHPGALGWLAVAALAGVVALDLSGVTRGEVERIWIPYAAWPMTATALLRVPARGPLLAQAVTALAIEAVVRSPW
jgi:methylthioxylose transferase